MLGRTAYLGSADLKNLGTWQYKGVDNSLLSCNVYVYYWNWLIKFVPLSIAPNLLTLTGILSVMAACILGLIYSPDLTTSYPSWLYYVIGASLWVYMSLDAIDGKQARRTGTSGPLGEFFDHGCDSIIIPMITGFFAAIFHIAPNWELVSLLYTGMAVFYAATWEQYHSGVLYIGVVSGPVEGMTMLILTCLATGYWGRFPWSSLATITLPDPVQTTLHIQWKHIFVALYTLSGVATIIQSHYHVLKGKRGKLGKILGHAPFVAFLLANAWISAVQNAKGDPTHTIWFTLMVGAGFCNVVARIIIARLTKRGLPKFSMAFMPTMLIAAGLAARWALYGRENMLLGQYDLRAVQAGAVFNVLCHMDYLLSVIRQICKHFDISCLSIKHKISKKL